MVDSWNAASASLTLVFSMDSGCITLSLSLWAIFSGIPNSMVYILSMCMKLGFSISDPKKGGQLKALYYEELQEHYEEVIVDVLEVADSVEEQEDLLPGV